MEFVTTTYMTRTIKYLGEVKHVIRGYMASLPTIGNLLILRGDMYIPPGKLEDWELVAAIREALEDLCPVGLRDLLDTAKNLILEIPDDFDPLPTWDRVDGFQMLNFSSVLEILGIPCYHGWVVDLENPGERTYYDLTRESVWEKLMIKSYRSITDKGSQLLLERLKENEICLVYYLSRLFPVIKHGDQLLRLDVEYASDYNGPAVWRTFDGDTLDDNFNYVNQSSKRLGGFGRMS